MVSSFKGFFFLNYIFFILNRKTEIIEPQSVVLARLCVMCILSAIESTNKSPVSKKRPHPGTDSDDAIDQVAPIIKARKLNIDHDSSSGDFVFDTTAIVTNREPFITIREPLQSSLQNLFKIFAQFMTADDLSPRIYFIFQFLSLLVHVGDKDRLKPLLKLLPNGLVQNLLKIVVTNEITVGFVTRINDLSTVAGRQFAMSDLSLLRNIQLRNDGIDL